MDVCMYALIKALKIWENSISIEEILSFRVIENILQSRNNKIDNVES